MWKKISLVVFLAILGCATFDASALETVQEAVIGDDGRVYRLIEGTYGDLFSKAPDGQAENSVLALEVVEVDGASSLQVVPGTEDSSVESAGTLLSDSGVLHIVWESRSADGGGRLLLSDLENGEWAPVIEVAEESGAIQGAPKARITRDAYTVLDEEGQRVRVQRTFLHLLWAREIPDGVGEVVYAPVLFVDGSYLGWNPAVVLDDLVEAGSGTPVPSSFLPEPSLEEGVDKQALLAAFADHESGRMLTVEIRALPGGLGRLARDVGRLVIEEGRQAPPGDIEALAGGVGSAMIDVGFDFHMSVRGYLALEAQAEILGVATGGPGPGLVLQNLADKVGSAMIDVGSKSFGNDGLDRNYDPERLRIVRLSREQGESAPIYEAEPAHLVRLYVTSNRTVPEVEGGHAAVFVSSDGAKSLLCWESKDAISYRESVGEAWGETKSILVGAGIEAGQVEKMLRGRVRTP